MVGPSAGPASTTTRRAPGLSAAGDWPDRARGLRRRHRRGELPRPPGDIVIADNLAHKVAGVRQAIERVGATLCYLPPYSSKPSCAPPAVDPPKPSGLSSSTLRFMLHRPPERTRAVCSNPPGVRPRHRSTLRRLSRPIAQRRNLDPIAQTLVEGRRSLKSSSMSPIPWRGSLVRRGALRAGSVYRTTGMPQAERCAPLRRLSRPTTRAKPPTPPRQRTKAPATNPLATIPASVRFPR